MLLVIDQSGTLHCVYDETIDLRALGQLRITRASHVEPDEKGQWLVNLAPVNGPILGPFAQRSMALAAERAWLDDHWPPPGN